MATVVINLTPLNVIEEADQLCLKKSRCFSMMEPWQRRESDGMSVIHEKAADTIESRYDYKGLC